MTLAGVAFLRTSLNSGSLREAKWRRAQNPCMLLFSSPAAEVSNSTWQTIAHDSATSPTVRGTCTNRGELGSLAGPTDETGNNKPSPRSCDDAAPSNSPEGLSYGTDNGTRSASTSSVYARIQACLSVNCFQELKRVSKKEQLSDKHKSHDAHRLAQLTP